MSMLSFNWKLQNDADVNARSTKLDHRRQLIVLCTEQQVGALRLLEVN